MATNNVINNQCGNILFTDNTISSTNTNGDIIITPDGTGAVEIGANTSKPSTIRFREDADNGTNAITITAPSTLAADLPFILPFEYPTIEGAVMTGSMANGQWAWGILNGTPATQAEQESPTSVVGAVTPGRQQYHPGHPKAWAQFSGTGTPAIISEYNCTSITDNDTGDWSIVFTVGFATANSCAIATGDNSVASTGVDILATSTTEVRVRAVRWTDNTNQDLSVAYVACFGDQA